MRMSTTSFMKTIVLGAIVAIGLSACIERGDAVESDIEQAVLTAPTGIGATATSPTRITVTWSPVAGASVYYIYRSSGGGPLTAVAAVHDPGTSHDDANLVPSTTYTYAVTAYDPLDQTESPLSATVMATTQDASGGLTPPATVTATAISSSRIAVNWSAVSGAQVYYVFQSDAGGPFVAVAAVSSTSHDAVNLIAETEYCYQIASFANGIMSAPSTPSTCATTLDATGGLTAPTNVTAMGTGPDRISVQWNPVATATAYYIWESAANAPYVLVGATSDPVTTLTRTGLSSTVEYCYQVQAANGGGTSALSMPEACASPVAAGSSARYKFDNDANDASMGGFHGSLIGSATFVSTDKAPLMDENKKNPTSLSVPASANSGVSVPSAGAFAFNDDFTISLWVKAGAAGQLSLVGKRAAGCGTVDWELGQNGSGLYFAGATTMAQFGASVSTSAWTNVLVTQSGGTVTLYVNGASVGTGAYTASPDMSDPLQIGNSGGCGSSASFLMDEVRLYNRVLSPAEVTSVSTLPPAPSGMQAVAVTATRVDISWTPVPDASRYLVYKGTSAGGATFLTTMPAASSTYIEGHAVPGQTTYWQIRAVNQSGLMSGFSAEVSVTAFGSPPPPTNVAATAVSDSKIEITWTAEPRAFVYYIYMSTGGGPYTAIGAVTSPNTSFVAGNLSPMTTYSFQVTTMDAGYVEGLPSPAVSATTL